MLGISVFILLAGIKICRIIAKKMSLSGLRIVSQHGDHPPPDSAVCRITGRSPKKMLMCPILNFDDQGVLCVPEICDEYEEVEE